LEHLKKKNMYRYIIMEDITQHKNKRKVRAPERYRPDGTYYTGPKDPKTYFNNYYHTKGATEEACQYCGESVRRAYMYRHLHIRACKTDRVNLLKIITELGEESPIHVRNTSDE
jgi:hypothetical protein